MAHNVLPLPGAHDLLELDVNRFLTTSMPVPDWVKHTLLDVPFAVCRRSPALGRRIAIGVRGVERDQRWPGTCLSRTIISVTSPQDLSNKIAKATRVAEIPALQSFELLKDLWGACDISWVPTGSVGFELATGRFTATRRSDLDVVIQAPILFSKELARSLCEATIGFPSKLDVRVETPVSGFSLQEYASTSRILLRLPQGSRLGTDPWNIST